MLPAHKNSKPRTVPARMSAKRRAQFEAEGRVPYSTIRKVKPCLNLTTAQNAKRAGNVHGTCSESHATYSKKSFAQTAKKTNRLKRSKRIPPRKKRSSTPIRSKPFENRLNKRSHWTASGNLKLYGKDKIAEREKIFARAGGRCEETFVNPQFVNGCHAVPSVRRCPNKATEWSHDQHGAKKSDAFDAGIASCTECHRRRHGHY